MENDRIRRPVRLADFLVVGAGFLHNVSESFSVLTEEIMQLAIHNANRETELNNVWSDFSTELEKITEDEDGNHGFN
jgi:hypothetical protein